LSPKAEREDQGSRFLGEVGILHYWFRIGSGAPI